MLKHFTVTFFIKGSQHNPGHLPVTTGSDAVCAQPSGLGPDAIYVQLRQAGVQVEGVQVARGQALELYARARLLIH